MGKVIIVDESDQQIGLKEYGTLQYEDIYRVSALWLTDLTGTYCLLTQRQLGKRNDPGKWMFAVSGTVEEGETYDNNIIKEIEEEIGLSGLDVHRITKQFVDEGQHKFFVQYFGAKVDKDTAEIVIQPEEVEDYAWMKIEDFVEDVVNNPEKYVSGIYSGLQAVGLKK